MKKQHAWLITLLIWSCSLAWASPVSAEHGQATANAPDLAVSNITQNSAQITWESVPGSNRYELAYGTDPKASNRPPVFVNALTTLISQLVPNTIYRVRVRAIVAGQAGDWSRLVEFSTQIPAMSDLAADDVRNSSIHLVWSGRYSDLPDISYEISYGTDPDASSDGTRLTDKTFLTLQNLSPETRYFIKMRVKNPKTVGPWSQPISSTTLAFGPEISPKGLTIRNTDQSEVMVEWQPMNRATSYDLSYGTDLQAANMGIMPVERNRFTLHLSPNSRYYFKVRSVTSGSTGPWSAVQPVLTLPSRPRGVNVSAVTSSQAVIEWQSLSGTQQARYYHFSWGTDPAGTNRGVTVTAMASYTLTRLDPDQPYSVRIRTVNESGVSGWSDPLIFTTLPAGFSKVEIFDIKHTSARVKWPPQSQATAYEVAYSQDREGYYELLEDVKQPPAELKNLRPDTAYYVKVRPILAQNRQAGAWSNAITFATFAVPPAPENLTVVESGGTYARISWTASETIGTYEVLLATDEFAEEGRSQAFSQPEARVSGLEGNTRYYVKVRARNLGGSGAWSRIVDFVTLPSASPIGLHISNITPTEAFVAWEVLPGSVQAMYQLRYSTLNGEWKTVSSHAGRTLNLTNLEADQDYKIQVRGQNSSGFGPWTAESSFKTPPLPPSAAPAGLAAKDVDDVSAVAVWSPMRQQVLCYHVSMGTDADASNRGVTTCKTATFPIKGLVPETSYFVKVRGCTAAGEGPWSDTLLITTRPTPPITAPPNVRVTDIAGDSIILSWDKSQEALSYEVSIGTDRAGENSGEPVTVPYSPFIFTKLKPDQTYRVKVRCVNRGGPGPWSQALPATTLKE